METMTASDQTNHRFVEIARRLGPEFARRAAQHDAEGKFVSENYAQLKEHRLMSAGVPSELGGGGASHAELCELLRELGRYCGSTALALSMHTHLVAAAVWRHRHGQPAEALLRKVAASELVLVSTGAGDWIDSVGKAERAPGGYRITARKRFASGSPIGDLMITTAPYDDPERGAEVLHFPLSLRAEGVRVHDDWDTLGMRGTGSNTIELDGAFVPDEAISLRRPAGKWHPSWNVVVTVAPPIFMAAYMGVAERAAELARDAAKTRKVEPVLLQLLGELENTLAVARMAFRELVENANGYDFDPVIERANKALIHKTIAANAVRATVDKALELIGGGALFRRHELERLLRDIQGAPFHPLPEKKQLDFTGRVALGLEPIA
jgi:alkylation response protein AidB-like acyl-CoA dehydrogenase